MADQVQGAAKPPPKGKPGEILGMPSWLAIAGGTVLLVGAYLMWRKHQLAAASASSATNSASIDPQTGQPYAAGVGSLATTGSSMNGYGADALYSQLVGLQGQVSNLSNSSNSVLTADNTTAASDQTTTTADQATTAADATTTAAVGAIPATIAVPTPAAPNVPLPPAPPPQDPNLHYTSDGSISLNTLAAWNNSTPARIIAATQASEPSDVANYLKLGEAAIMPVGTKWNIPRN